MFLQLCLFINIKNVCLQLFEPLLKPELKLIDKSGLGNKLYLFVMEILLLLFILLRNGSYTYV